MIHDVVERSVELRLGTLPAGKRESAEQLLRAEIVIVLAALAVEPKAERLDVVGNAGAVLRSEDPAGQDARELFDSLLIIARDRSPLAVAKRCSIRMQELGSDREELQQLARIVFVRLRR
jgi:hypothetical protein